MTTILWRRATSIHWSIKTILLLVAISTSFKIFVVLDPNPRRYSDQIVEFVSKDRNLLTDHCPVVFVGSSSVRRWNIDNSFPEVYTLNRGFGGSQLSDLIFYAEETVIKHRPAIVVVYAGENDVAAGKSSSRILRDYQKFVNLVLKEGSPKILYLSIKPSPKRWSMWPKMERANKLLEQFSDQYTDLHYVDLGSTMLNDYGKIRPELYASDGIHLSEAGYVEWTLALKDLLFELRSQSCKKRQQGLSR